MSKPSEDQLRQAIDAVFSKYDTDKSNTLDNSELKNVIRDAFGQLGAKREVTDEDIKKFLGAVDRNSDGKVTKSQLLEIFKRLTGSI